MPRDNCSHASQLLKPKRPRTQAPHKPPDEREASDRKGEQPPHRIERKACVQQGRHSAATRQINDVSHVLGTRPASTATRAYQHPPWESRQAGGRWSSRPGPSRARGLGPWGLPEPEAQTGILLAPEGVRPRRLQAAGARHSRALGPDRRTFRRSALYPASAAGPTQRQPAGGDTPGPSVIHLGGCTVQLGKRLLLTLLNLCRVFLPFPG